MRDFVFRRKLVGIVEDEIEHRRMRLEQQVGRDGGLHFIGARLAKPGWGCLPI